MQRITTATRFIDKFGPGKDGFNDGNDTTGVSSTQLDAAAFDNYQEEIANAIELAGIQLDPTDMTQLSQAIGRVAGNYVQKTGDIMTGQLAMQGAGTAIQYSPPTTLLYGPWDPQGIGFGWDGVGALRVRIYDVDVGLLPLNINPGSFVLKTGDTMSGTLTLSGAEPQIAITSANAQFNLGSTLAATLISAGNDTALRFDGRAGNIWQLAYSTATSAFSFGTPPYPDGAWVLSGDGFTTQFGNVSCFQFNGNALDPFAGIVVQTTNCVKAIGGEWIGPSDARIKKDVEDYTTGLEQVCALRPVTFKFNGQGGTQDNGRTHIGLIAQEAQAFVPEIFFDMEAMMRNPLDGTPTPQSASMLPGQFGMDASALKYALVNAVKELAARVMALEGTPHAR